MKKILIFLLFPVFAAAQSNTLYTVDAAGNINVTLIGVPAGNTIQNTVTETAFAEPQYPIPPTMWFIGRTFHLDVAGMFNTALVVPSITGKIKLGSTVIGSTGPIAMVGSIGNKQWSGSVNITVTSIGATGTVEVQGTLYVQAATGTIPLPIVNTAPITIDMTVPQTLNMTATWSAASTSNSITLRQFWFHG